MTLFSNFSLGRWRAPPSRSNEHHSANTIRYIKRGACYGPPRNDKYSVCDASTVRISSALNVVLSTPYIYPPRGHPKDIIYAKLNFSQTTIIWLSPYQILTVLKGYLVPERLNKKKIWIFILVLILLGKSFRSAFNENAIFEEWKLLNMIGISFSFASILKPRFYRHHTIFYACFK